MSAAKSRAHGTSPYRNHTEKDTLCCRGASGRYLAGPRFRLDYLAMAEAGSIRSCWPWARLGSWGVRAAASSFDWQGGSLGSLPRLLLRSHLGLAASCSFLYRYSRQKRKKGAVVKYTSRLNVYTYVCLFVRLR